ncbi:hypothetical protein EB001_13270 [bacterium]|jgi:hypothetical protein|nr:hypothetical protein [bacterium]
MTTQIKSNDDLLSYLVSQAGSGQKNWFGFAQQRLTGIALAHDIAKNHADKLSPEEVVDYAVKLNNAIYQKIIKAD